MEILLLHPGGLGDIILSLPAIALLRERSPAARISIAGNIDHLAPLTAGYAERAIALSTLPLHRLYTPNPLPDGDVRFWKSFDRVVSWTGSGDSDFTRKLRDIHPDVIIASWRPAPAEARHVSRLFVDSLRLGIPPETEVEPAQIHLSSTLRDAGTEWLGTHGWSARDSLIAIHPGAGSKTKRWPLANFVCLAQRLMRQKKSRLLIIEGPAESELGREVAKALSPAKVILVESVTLSLLAAILERCIAFVGNDSGLAHLAAGLGVPSVVLFGPTLPKHWAPLGRHVVALRDPRGCNACITGRGDHTCLGNISVDEVRRSSASLRRSARVSPIEINYRSVESV